MAEPKVWFITGASSGFGRSMTELLLNKGDKVIATLRHLDALSDLSAQFPSQLLVIQLDVTNSAEVSAAFARAKEAFGRIDVVFNNAGQCVAGELESVSEEEARQMFEVNFWGAMHVSKEAVKFFREVNKPIGGRLLGLVGGPATAFYTPAYANPDLPGSKVRQFMASGNIDGDADKAVVAIEKLTHLDDVPMRLPLHRKVDVNKFESWSEDLYH
ncbi:NAD(P)-binding protein [Suillus subalutaceus]|uniref:NAD(P)-binding protein n=1 Tax=Suillus subalutaceus TaxID=48586 RepID=UPI001B8663CC|nr:NAD(P)-binding protein [Suillus subalutaceus]KAG1842889.1 NAD(P)-binding protein [Suillus subalutaceus]